MKTKTNVLDPWVIDVEERKQIFLKAKKQGKKLALYYSKAPDSTTFRYRVYNVFQATLKSKKWQAVYFFKNELEVINELLSQADLLVFGRESRWEKTVEKVFEEAKKKKIPTIFDLDDLVFDKKYMKMVTNIIGEKNTAEYWVPYFKGVYETARRMDGFLATNDLLATKISENYKKSAKVIRNSLNEEQLAASNAYLCLKEGRKKKGFSIGYFSGTPTHANDLAVAMPEIIEFLNNHKDAKLVVVGNMEFDNNAKQLLDEGRIVFKPPVDFRKLQRAMSEVDVNVAPLISSLFTDCKSELKYFEAAAVKTTTIASPTFTFARAIEDGKNGFLACPGEWYDKLEYLYNNPEKNAEIANRAREEVLEKYTGKQFLTEIEGAYDFFLK